MSFPSRSPSIQVDLDEVDEARPSNTPAHRLLVAILRRAIWDFVLYRDEKKFPDQRGIAEDAAGWLFWDGKETCDDEGRYTFLYVCEELELDHVELRRRVLSMTRDDIKKLNHHIKED